MVLTALEYPARGFLWEGAHSDGVENQWSIDRDWSRGYNRMDDLRRTAKGRQVYHNQVKGSSVPV